MIRETYCVTIPGTVRKQNVHNTRIRCSGLRIARRKSVVDASFEVNQFIVRDVSTGTSQPQKISKQVGLNKFEAKGNDETDSDHSNHHTSNRLNCRIERKLPGLEHLEALKLPVRVDEIFRVVPYKIRTIPRTLVLVSIELRISTLLTTKSNIDDDAHVVEM